MKENSGFILWFMPTVSIFFLLMLQGCGQTAAEDPMTKAATIHRQVLTIDTHVDTPLNLEKADFNIGRINNPHQDGGKVDFPRMKQGGLDAIFFAVFIGQGPRNPEAFTVANAQALIIFDLIHKAVTTHWDQAELALRADDAYRIEKSGKRAIYIGVENGYPIGNDLTLLKKYYDLGARYVTLCHTQNNDICDSSTDKKGPEHNGLSEFGKRVVLEMNRLGLIVDVSHISDKAFYDVLELSRAPVMASHSCSRAICNNPRNLTDDMLKKLAQKDGVIQLCILGMYVKDFPVDPKRQAAEAEFDKKYPDYYSLSPQQRTIARQDWHALNNQFPRPMATVAEAIDHIDHIVKIIGINHVGIGTDFDGGGGLKDCVDVSEMGNITAELVKRGYSQEDIAKIWGGNFIRVFKAVEATAKAI